MIGNFVGEGNWLSKKGSKVLILKLVILVVGVLVNIGNVVLFVVVLFKRRNNGLVLLCLLLNKLFLGYEIKFVKMVVDKEREVVNVK